jgi:hypothetical protein
VGEITILATFCSSSASSATTAYGRRDNHAAPARLRLIRG